MPLCIACKQPCVRERSHQFTTREPNRSQWLAALSRTDADRARMEILLRTSASKQYVCPAHFDSDCYEEVGLKRVLKPFAVPLSQRQSSIDYDPSGLTSSPPPTPLHHQSLHLPPPSSSLLLSTPLGRPQSAFRVPDERPPLCCRCCCKKETAADFARDPDWTPPPPTIDLPLSKAKYAISSISSIVELLTPCRKCLSGENSLRFSENALALTCKCECTACGYVFHWSNSPVLPTANASAQEKLREVNVDVCVGSTVTAVGTSKLNHFLHAVGLNQVSPRTFHRHKNDYIFSAVQHVFEKTQDEVFERLRERIRKGEKINLAGDGSFDTRGHSAMWCRYYLCDAETGEALVYVLMNKRETGSSGKLEVECLEKALNALAAKIGGVQHIATLVTDRHGAVITRMEEKFPTIRHMFDPWHFYRNLTLNLLKIIGVAYMHIVKPQYRILINKAYGAVVEANGDGTLASEMFLSSPYCLAGKHDFSDDPSFTKFKKCIHRPAEPDRPYIDERAFNRLMEKIYTERNVNDIKSTGKKHYYNHTLKKLVYRDVKTTATNIWRDNVKKQCYEIRAQMTRTPYLDAKKKQEEKERNMAKWDALSRPTKPHEGDPNLDLSEDEEAVEMIRPEDIGGAVDEWVAEGEFLLETD